LPGCGPSIRPLTRGLAKTLPAHLQPKVKGDPSNSLSRSIKHGNDLNRQRPALRRLVSALRAGTGLAVTGTKATNDVRDATKAGRDQRLGNPAEIELRAVGLEALNEVGRSLLLGEDYPHSFIIRPPQK
jgi:hypothetical protein